jgi:hypothetical protein
MSRIEFIKGTTAACIIVVLGWTSTALVDRQLAHNAEAKTSSGLSISCVDADGNWVNWPWANIPWLSPPCRPQAKSN